MQACSLIKAYDLLFSGPTLSHWRARSRPGCDGKSDRESCLTLLQQPQHIHRAPKCSRRPASVCALINDTHATASPLQSHFTGPLCPRHFCLSVCLPNSSIKLNQLIKHCLGVWLRPVTASRRRPHKVATKKKLMSRRRSSRVKAALRRASPRRAHRGEANTHRDVTGGEASWPLWRCCGVHQHPHQPGAATTAPPPPSSPPPRHYNTHPTCPDTSTRSTATSCPGNITTCAYLILHLHHHLHLHHLLNLHASTHLRLPR